MRNNYYYIFKLYAILKIEIFIFLRAFGKYIKPKMFCNFIFIRKILKKKSKDYSKTKRNPKQFENYLFFKFYNIWTDRRKGP